MKQKLLFYNEVKYSVRYNAIDKSLDNMFLSVYVLKTALKKPYPLVIEVTVEEVKE